MRMMEKSGERREREEEMLGKSEKMMRRKREFLLAIASAHKIGQVKIALGLLSELERRAIVTQIHWRDKKKRKAANPLTAVMRND